MSRLDDLATTMGGPERSLVDLPLRPFDTADFSLALRDHVPAASPAQASTARLPRRGIAFAADVVMVLLIWAAAVLVAGATPGPTALAWSAAFALLLSFFATVPALVLFGKTVGMAMACLSAFPSEEGRRLAAAQAMRRWLGTLATAATLGAALLWTLRSPDLLTPADRLSGRALVEDEPRA